MINVYSFQKMIHSEDCPDQKNISKTSQFVFGQNYKKLIANSKANFDFRRFIQKHSNTKKPFTTVAPKEVPRRNALEQVSTFQVNTQNNLQSKAFKIRCYSRKGQKQNEKQEEVIISKLVRFKPRIYPMKQVRAQQKRSKTNIDNKKYIRMHKFDNFQELQSIASNIKVYYNDFPSESDKSAEKAIVFDTNYLVACLKASVTKTSQKDKETQYFRKKVIFLLKRIIEDKFTPFPMEKESIEERPQIIFKTRSQDETNQLLRTFEQCEFNAFYCIFSTHYRCIESTSTYMLTKIQNLAQNITIVDSLENFTSHPPLLNSRHFVAFSTFNEKSNFGVTLEGLFYQMENIDIRFSADQFENQEPSYGILAEIPYKQLLQKVRQRKNLKQCKKSSRQKKQRCHSSYQGNYTHNERRNEQRNLESFKQKMLKYLKIIGNQNQLQSKRSKQLPSGNSQDLQCLTGRQKCSKTNNQIVSQLIKLNSNVHKQISGYQRKMEQFQIDTYQQSNQTASFVRFQKVYINSLH